MAEAHPKGRLSGSKPGGGKSGLLEETVAANGRRGQPQGQCHRKQTAPGLNRGKGETVR